MKQIHYFGLEKNQFDLVERLKEDIALAGMRGFEGDVTKDDVLHHFFGADYSILALCRDKVVGFTSVIEKEDHMYFFGTTIDHDFQGMGIYHNFLMQKFAHTFNKGYSEIRNHTQNPIVFSGIVRSLDHLKNRGIIKGYTTEKTIEKERYGMMLTGRRPFSTNKELNEEFDVLDYGAGDAFSIRYVFER